MPRFKVEQKPIVCISRAAYYKLFAYAKAAPGEVTGFGTVEQTENAIRVSDIYIMPQRATGAGCHITGEDLAGHMARSKAMGRPERIERAHLWWHSHADFNVFRSGTDDKTVDLLLSVMPFLLCIVVNKRGHMECSLHLKSPTRMSFNNLPVYQEDFDAEAIDLDVEREVKELVKEFNYRPIKEPTYSSPISVGPEFLTDPEQSKIPFEDSPERAYLDELNKLGGKPPIGETPWDRYKREKGLHETQEKPDLKRAFEMSDEEWERFEKQDYPLDWAEQNERELERSKKSGDTTKRYIVEEGIIRPDDTRRDKAGG